MSVCVKTLEEQLNTNDKKSFAIDEKVIYVVRRFTKRDGSPERLL